MSIPGLDDEWQPVKRDTLRQHRRRARPTEHQVNMADSQQVDDLSPARSTSSRCRGKFVLLFAYLFVCVVTSDHGAQATLPYCTGFPHCDCTATKLACVDSGLPNISFMLEHYKGSEASVENITIVGDTFLELPPNLLGACPPHQWTSLRYMDLSNNSIRTIHGKTFHCTHNLETLILRDNDWRVYAHPDRNGYFTSITTLKHLDLTNAFEENYDGSIHLTKLEAVFNVTNLDSLENLTLAHNEFFSFTSSMAASLCGFDSMRRLNLSHNYLLEPLLKPLQCLKKLEVLDLSYNRMSYLSQDLREMLGNQTSLKEIYLEGNSFECDCGLIDTYTWLQRTTLPLDKTKLVCADGYHSSYIGKQVTSLDLADLKCYQAEAPSRAPAIVLGLIFGIIACAILGFAFIHRKKLATCCSKYKQRLPTISSVSHSGYSTVVEQV